MADTIPQLIFEAARRHAGRHAIVDETGRRLAFNELAAAVRAAAKAFIAAGLRPREAVGLWAPNSAEWVVAAVGVQAAGGVLVPLNTRLAGREVADIVDRAQLRLLVTAGEFLGRDYPSMLAGYQLPQLRAKAWCKANFANYKVPRSIRFVDALPMNASGKVLKDVLRAHG